MIKGHRAMRMVNIAARLLTYPTKALSLTLIGNEFGVSKSAISDDMDTIGTALQDLGRMAVGRGRGGGARFYPQWSEERRKKCLSEIAERLSEPDRRLPGDFLYYSDIIFEPETAFSLGYCMASLFTEKTPDVVMTTEVKGIPIGLFTAHALGVPLAVCRFRNRPTDGPSIGVHYPTANGDIKTMYMGTKQLKPKSKVLVIDDFMRGGSTAYGMWLMAEQFKAEVCGTGIFIAHEGAKDTAIPEYRSLLTLKQDSDGSTKIEVSD